MVQGEEQVNEFVLEGQLAHRNVHQAGTHSIDGEIKTTNLYLYSETLHLTGFADLVEERAGMFIPVEFKVGHKGNWINDHIQLCAQAMCLEERQAPGAEIPYGYIYYVGSRRRVQIPFTPQLRTKTKAAIAEAFKVAALAAPPPPLTGPLMNRCPPCSLFPICMPDEVRQLRSQH